ncbi:MAG: ribosome silencing factor [Oscillospiraceae bacterium]
MTSFDTAKKIVGALEDLKAKNIKVIKIDTISTLCDYFVIATGTSSTHVQALSDTVEHKLKEAGVLPSRIEGYRSTGWILSDYNSVVLHVFTQEARDFYDLDRLWSDGEEIDVMKGTDK